MYIYTIQGKQFVRNKNHSLMLKNIFIDIDIIESIINIIEEKCLFHNKSWNM